MSSPDVSGWLLTYAVHSTVLLLVAAIAAHRFTSHRARETLWKTALFGGFITATGQTLLQLRPLAGRMTITATADPQAPDPAGNPLASGAIAGRLAETPDGSGPADLGAGAPAGTSRSWPRPGTVFIGVWAAGAFLLLGRYLVRRVRFARRLAVRREVLDGAVADMLRELCATAGITRPIRLTASAALPSPVALGAGEIAVPAAALTDLDAGQQRSMLAHELAHLERSDPAWLTAACLAECVGWLQPFNRIALRRMQESAEYLCDEWAVKRTGSGVLLAKCLAKVAEWLETAPRSLPVAGMAEDRSHLVARVRRLLDGAPFPRSPGRKVLMFSSLAIVAVTIVALPGVSLARHNTLPVQPSGAALSEEQAQDPRSPGNRAIVSALLGALKDPNVEVRRAAIRSLAQHQDPAALPAFREALRDGDVEIRGAALQALSEMHDAASVDAIVALLKDANKEIRANAISALTELELTAAPAGLRDALRDPDAEVRHQAAHAVGHFEDAAAVPALRGLLEDTNADVREAAVEALAAIRNEAAIEALIGALKAKDAKVREAAADALGKRRE